MERRKEASKEALGLVETDGWVIIRTSAKENEQVCPDFMETVARTVMRVDDPPAYVDSSQKGCWAGYNGKGGSNRAALFPNSNWISAAEGAPKALPVEFHNEVAYSRSFPIRICFGMFDQSADYEGGQTRLIDNVKVTKELLSTENESLRMKLERLGVQYVRHIKDDSEEPDPSHKGQSLLFGVARMPLLTSWQLAWPTATSIEEARRIAAEDLGELEKIESPELGSDGHDRTVYRHVVRRPVFHKHPELNQLLLLSSILNRHRSWVEQPTFADRKQALSARCNDKKRNFDNMSAFSYGSIPFHERPYDLLWGDGTEFSTSEIETIRSIHLKHEFHLQLRPGDMVIADNLRMQHGRMPWGGTTRKLGLMIFGMTDRDYC